LPEEIARGLNIPICCPIGGGVQHRRAKPSAPRVVSPLSCANCNRIYQLQKNDFPDQTIDRRLGGAEIAVIGTRTEAVREISRPSGNAKPAGNHPKPL